jgi:hypothetical protein
VSLRSIHCRAGLSETCQLAAGVGDSYPIETGQSGIRIVPAVVLVIFVSALIPVPLAAQGDIHPSQIDTVLTPDESEIVTVAPATSVIATDHKYDGGEQIDLSWVPSIDDQLTEAKVIGYKIYRAEEGGEPELLAELPPQSNNYEDQAVETGKQYSYFISALSINAEFPSVTTALIAPQREWLNLDLKYVFLMALILGGAVVYFI